MRYFDYERVAREAGLDHAALDELQRAIRKDFPTDEMLFELHMLRAVKAVRDGRLAVRDFAGSSD